MARFRQLPPCGQCPLTAATAGYNPFHRRGSARLEISRWLERTGGSKWVWAQPTAGDRPGSNFIVRQGRKTAAGKWSNMLPTKKMRQIKRGPHFRVPLRGISWKSAPPTRGCETQPISELNPPKEKALIYGLPFGRTGRAASGGGHRPQGCGNGVPKDELVHRLSPRFSHLIFDKNPENTGLFGTYPDYAHPLRPLRRDIFYLSNKYLKEGPKHAL